jgi:PIN domain nuclease of toxin-antitoxin system
MVLSPEKLTQHQVSVITDVDNQICFSMLSIVEISIKYSLGKLSLNGGSPEEFYRLLLEMGLQEDNLTYSIASSYYRLPKKDNHKDPFDRLLIWQAIQTKTPFVTRDKKHNQYVEDGLILVS